MTVPCRAVLLSLVLGLAGCEVTRLPNGTLALVNAGPVSYAGVQPSVMRTPYPIIPGLNFTTEKDARALAAVLIQAHDTRGGMPGVAADVQRCYAAADADNARNAAWPSEYRFCVLYDAVAYRIDNSRARDRGLPRTPYFEPEVSERRWERHILLAGQGRRSELDAFMVKGSAAAGRFLPARLLASAG